MNLVIRIANSEFNSIIGGKRITTSTSLRYAEDETPALCGIQVRAR